jgi:hypothetical protein
LSNGASVGILVHHASDGLFVGLHVDGSPGNRLFELLLLVRMRVLM